MIGGIEKDGNKYAVSFNYNGIVSRYPLIRRAGAGFLSAAKGNEYLPFQTIDMDWQFGELYEEPTDATTKRKTTG